MQSEPRHARMPVWALPRSLAATYGIIVIFSSSGYLDVSVRRVPSAWLWIHHTVTCSACRVSPFRHPRINAHVQLPAAFRSLSRLSSAPSARASALRPTMLNLLHLRLIPFDKGPAAQSKTVLNTSYRRICKTCPSCSLVLLAIAFSIYIRVIDSNFFYQRRGLMFDVFSIQFSRYGRRITGMCLRRFARHQHSGSLSWMLIARKAMSLY